MCQIKPTRQICKLNWVKCHFIRKLLSGHRDGQTAEPSLKWSVLRHRKMHSSKRSFTPDVRHRAASGGNEP